MPKVVDHELRRRELARAALRVIGRDGLEAATTRAVAEESGWSTGVLKHYFDDKDHLLHEALRELERMNIERFERARDAPDGRAAIGAALAGILRGGADESRVWIAFMFRASVDRATAAAMRRAIQVWVARWADLVVSGQQDGSIRPDLDPDQVAAELHALINGLRIQASFRSRRSSAVRAERQLVFLQSLDPEDATTRRPLEVAP
ncbi:MAG TPA: TetR/AcrR family transcriptional regulator [Desertimonas sp.]|nr:TetR/AcrR family transcriptional regulator [Desertimonas sp.]